MRSSQIRSLQLRLAGLFSSVLLLAGVIHAGTVQAAPAVQFGTPLPVSAADGRAMGPDVGIGADGTVHMLWIDKAPVEMSAEDKAAGHTHTAADQLWYRRSVAPTKDGVVAAWRAPVRVNSRDGEVWGFAISKPELDIDGRGNIHVFYSANDKRADGKNLLVARYTRSTDGGTSFEPGRTLNSPATNDLSAVMHGGFAAAHAFGTIIANGNDVQAFWIDTRAMKETDTAGAIWRAVSRDGGATFGADTIAYANNICPCCQLAAATVGDRVLLSNRKTYPGGFRDGAVGAASSPTAPFGDEVRVGEGQWKIDGCPLKRAAIAASGDNVYTASYTGGRDPAGVYFSRSTDGGASFEPAVAMHPGAAVSDAPTLATSPNGTVYIAWHGKTDSGRRVFVRVSTDHGVNFSPVTELPSPAGTAAYPEFDIAPDGSAWLAWQQDQVVYVTRVTAL
ncbi:MAG: sialidase family protein [Gammaproteobacteria bacterium]